MLDRNLHKLPRLLVRDGSYNDFPSSAASDTSGPSPLKRTSKSAPRWPGITRLALNLLIVFSATTLLGLVSNSAFQYSHTKGINFSGYDMAWPQDLDVLPTEYLLAVAVVTLIASLIASVQSYRRLHAQMLSLTDKIFVGLAIILFGAWIGGNVILNQSLGASKPNMMRWACHRRDSPTNVLVSYSSVCQEQVSKRSK